MIGRCVVIGVTAGTIRLIRGEQPGNDLIVSSVTINAKYRRPVITRVIGRVMPEYIQWYPTCGGVTTCTIKRCDEMRCCLAGGGCAVMTAQAQSGYVAVVEAGTRKGCC